jgi:4'-phosphopantetheinyl transferase EntD
LAPASTELVGQVAARDDASRTQPESAPKSGSDVIERILPPGVACSASLSDDISTSLYPGEAALMRGAAEARLREFATARTCARLAIAQLGLPAGPILRGVWREPIWPPGVVGSITHCSGYRAAAVAKQRDVLSVGIDAEPDEQLPPGILELVAVAQEQAWLASARPGVHWDRLLFSAKESVFKAWFPLARAWLGFEQAVVTFHPTECTFHVRLLVPLPVLFGVGLQILTGRFLVWNGVLLTSIVVPNKEGVVSKGRVNDESE